MDQIHGSKLGVYIFDKNLKYPKSAQNAGTFAGAYRISTVAMVSSENPENTSSPSMPKLLSHAVTNHIQPSAHKL